jgi:peptide/nickel transport system ATP-binding protein
MSFCSDEPPRPFVEVEALRVRFGPNAEPVVRGVSFSVTRGECLAFVGESGSGKSVVARSLIGLTGRHAVVDAAHLSIDGEDLIGCTESRWQGLRGRRIGFVNQDALGGLDPLRKVGQEIAEPLLWHSKAEGEALSIKVVKLLASVGVPEPELRINQRPPQLSGGLRQRALIASAIACEPDLLIADEPTTALDAIVQKQILDLLAALCRHDRSLIIISHDFGVVARLADHVAVMRHGVIVEHGPVEAIVHEPRHAYTRELISATVRLRGKRRSRSSPHAVTTTATSAPRLTVRPGITIEVCGVTKVFCGFRDHARAAVSNVSFVLHPGETLGVVGESGSGKTTVARIVLGLESPDAGEVRLDGRTWGALAERERRDLRRRVQVVFQDPGASFDPRYTVADVLEESLAVAGLPRGKLRRARAIELLERVKLDESHLRRRPDELSGGQRQRVAIARALAPDPDLIVCDEPVSALDVAVQVEILDLLTSLKEEAGLSLLFISHDLGVIYQICDRILVMKDGRVVETGDVHDIFDRPRHPYTRSLLSALPRIEEKGASLVA